MNGILPKGLVVLLCFQAGVSGFSPTLWSPFLSRSLKIDSFLSNRPHVGSSFSTGGLLKSRQCVRIAEEEQSVLNKKKKSVLFVCLGNICRSPAAEAVFQHTVDSAGLSDSYVIDSCGTGGGSPNWYREGGFSYHSGDPADSRMTEAANRRSVRITSHSRPLCRSDFERFDKIVHMDESNKMEIIRAANHWGIPQDKLSRVQSMMQFAKGPTNLRYVPDPYYGGPDGFEKVLDLLEDACAGLLEVMEDCK